MARVQEYIWRGFDGFRFGYYLTLCQFVMYSAFSAVNKLATGESLLARKCVVVMTLSLSLVCFPFPHLSVLFCCAFRAPIRIFGLLCIIIVINYSTANASLVYIDYATKVHLSCSSPFPSF